MKKGDIVINVIFNNETGTYIYYLNEFRRRFIWDWWKNLESTDNRKIAREWHKFYKCEIHKFDKDGKMILLKEIK